MAKKTAEAEGKKLKKTKVAVGVEKATKKKSASQEGFEIAEGLDGIRKRLRFIWVNSVPRWLIAV